MKDLYKKIIIFVFALLMSFPTLFMGVFMEETKTEYKQYVEENPMDLSDVYTDQELIKIIRNLNDYYLQHIAKRQSMIDLWSQLLYKLNVSSSKSITIGQDDMLFYTSCMTESRGLKTYSDEDINAELNKIDVMNEFFESNSAEFLFVIAPNKGTIYPENYPAWYTSNGNLTYLDKINEQYEKGEYSYNYLDLTDVLTDAKEEYGDILYPDTDAHWSELGAYIGYTEIINNLTVEFDIAKLVDYQLNQHKSSSQMRMMGIKNDNKIDIFADIDYVGNEEYEIEYLTEVKNWKGYFKVSNENAINDTKVLLVRDSFSNALLPIFNATFTDLRLVHYHTVFIGDEPTTDIQEIIDEYQPDIVIFEIVERAVKASMDDLDVSIFE